MTSPELERVAADLSSIRKAMRLGKPYTWNDVALDLVTALCGLLAIVLILFSPLNDKLAFTLGLLPGVLYYVRFTVHQRRQRAANPSPWKEEKLTLKALAIALPLIVMWLLWNPLDSPSEGAPLSISGDWSAPANWSSGTNLIVVGDSEDSAGTLSTIPAGAGNNGLEGTAGHRGNYGSLAAAAALYFMGVALGVLGVIDSNRRRYLAASVVLIAFGMVSPYLTSQQMILGGAIALMAAGLLSAAITMFQLKSDGDLNQGELAS